MKKTFTLLGLIAFILLSGKTMAEDYLMQQFGYQTITVSQGNPITFYDMKNNEGISSSSSNNSFATAIFQPAEAGNSIQIVFESVDVRNDGAKWPANLSIYDGVFDVNSVSYPETTSGLNESSAFPTTDKLIEKLDGTYSNLTYTSSDATGAISVCYVYRYAKACQGWKATVSSVTLEAMTVKSVTADNSFVDGEVWAGKQNVAVAGMNILTEGYSSPDKLQSLSFSCSNNAVLDPTSLKLYAGKAATVANLKEIAGTITENEGAYTYTLTTSETFGNGDNYFTLGGDILSTATFGATVKVNITGIQTIGGFNSFTTAEAATLTVQPMYLMAEDATYTISQETNFYDNGGKDGKVTKGFNGKVVLQPATSGKKVKLNFNSIHLFYNEYAASSTGYVDYLKVYNGNSTDDKDLLWQATESDYSNVVIKSTADNGMLTITHKNNISSDSNLKDGWEAVVSEFVPQPMVVSTVETTKQTGNNVSAGTENVQMVSMKLTTAETEPALVVKSLSFNTNNTYQQISKARLYYTKDKTFSAANLLGEAEVTANSVVLGATNEVKLREGDNYLWLTYDIQPLAENGKQVDVVLEKLSFTNNTEYTTFTNTDGALTIKNVAVQACGEQTITVQGEWEYTHTVASEYSSKYKAEDCNQTIVFRPATAGNVVQIDYADFDVYYASSSWSTRAKYIVYAGEGTSGEVLWQLDENGKKPQQIRSNAANGALTIVFNPNTTSTYYTGDGWHATVTEYTPKQMEVKAVVVEQASTKLVKLGEQKAELLQVNLQTEGTLSPLTLDAATISLKGTEQNISKVYLLQGETVLAQAEAAATVTLTLATPLTLVEYDNMFTIAADVKDDATVEQNIDAALVSGKISGIEMTVENGDPEGVRPIKNVLYLQAGDNGTVKIGDNSLMFYDDGGAEDKYAAKLEGYVTFEPTHEGYAVEVVVKQYKLSNGAPIKLFYGRSYEGEADGVVEYNYSEPEKYIGTSFISSAEDGSLTIYFKDGGFSVNDGWEFEIKEHKLTDLAIARIQATSIASALQTVGAKDLRMLQIAVEVEGDRTPLNIDAINLTTNQHVDTTKLYQTGTVATFSDQEPFVAPYTISQRGTYYFWVTADARAQADDYDVISVSLNSIMSGEQTLEPDNAEVAQTKLAHGMRGVYYVGESTEAEPTDFRTVAAALDAMAVLGIEGNVVFNIVPGNYSEQSVLAEVKGASEAATVTFQSSTGNAADVVFLSNNTSDTEGVWTINGMDWVTLNNLTFKSDKEGYAAVLVLKNQSQHVTVDGCVFKTDAAQSSTTQTMQLIRLISEDEDNANCSYFTLKNSTLQGGYTALNLSQGAYATHPNQTGVSIIGNTFVGQQKQMIYGTMQKDITIIDNTITSTTIQKDCRAIDLRTKLEGHLLIAGNTINLTATGDGYVQGIYFDVNSTTNCPEGTMVDIYNNAISLTSEGSSVSAGIRLRWLREGNITYNTILLNSPYTTSAPLWLSNNMNNLVLTVTNNIMQNMGQGNVLNGVKGTYTHNAFYAANGNISNSQTTIADWETALSLSETGNLWEQAVFANDQLLLLREAGNLISATSIDDITTDITGKVRAAQPTIGAYEYDSTLFVVPAVADNYPQVKNIEDVKADVVVKANNMGTAYVLAVAAEASVPTVEEVIATGKKLTLQKDAEVAVTIDNLTEETTYKAYVVTESPVGETAQSVVATSEFTTLWTLRPVVLQAIQNKTVDENTALTLTAVLAEEYNQAKPYNYVWYNAFGDTLSHEPVLQVNAVKTTEYIVEVTDKYQQKAYSTTTVKVNKEAEMAGFEEYRLAANGNKHVEDAWTDNTPAWLYSGTYQFANTPNKSWDAYNGYAVCSDRQADATGNYMTDQFRSAAGGAAEGENFAVAYFAASSSWFAGYKDTIRLSNSADAQEISGFYITNTAYTYDAVMNGDYANAPFGKKDSTDAVQKDYLKLTIYGYNGSTRTATKDFYLADYRDDDADEHYALNTWEWLDLRELGEVTELQFEMFTTKSDDWGFTTPTYFALDNFGGKMPVDTLEQITITSGSVNVNLDEYFTNGEKGNVVYKVVDEQLTDMTYSLAGNLLQLTASSDTARAGLTISHTQRGKQQFKYLPVVYTFNTAIDNMHDKVSVYPTLVSDKLFVTTDAGQCRVDVYAADGRKVAQHNGNNNISINASEWVAGQYIVRVSTQNEVKVVTVLKK